MIYSKEVSSIRNWLQYHNRRRLLFRRIRMQGPINFNGFTFHGSYDWEIYEVAEKDLIFRLLSQMDTFLNIGANEGFYSMLAISCGVQTIAFEPDPTNLEILYRNIITNEYEEKIQVFPVAVGSENGISRIFGFSGTSSLVEGFRTKSIIPRIVPVVRLDDIFFGSTIISGNILILIDVEGFEQQVLKGASRILAMEHKPVWIIEILPSQHYDTPPTLNDIITPFEIMFEAGYVCHHIEGKGKYFHISQDMVRDHMKNIEKYGREYCYLNYIFSEKGIESILL